MNFWTNPQQANQIASGADPSGVASASAQATSDFSDFEEATTQTDVLALVEQRFDPDTSSGDDEEPSSTLDYDV